MPPTLAGVTRLTNELARDISTVGTNGTGSGTLPTVPTADATYVVADIAAAPSSQYQLAEPRASTLSSTRASCGSRM